MLNNDQALRAARQGRVIHKWKDSVTGLSGSHVVSTDAGIYYNIPEGKQVIIANMVMGLDTTNDTVHAYFVGCTAVAGGGDATQLSNHQHYVTGAAKEGRSEHDHPVDPQICVKYSDGYRSVSLALAANDQSADMLVGWDGWVEDEGTLS